MDKDIKEICWTSGNVYIGSYYDDMEECLSYVLYAYEPVQTSGIIDFYENDIYYYFETLHHIYQVKKDELMKVSYKNQIDELKKYLKSEEFEKFKNFYKKYNFDKTLKETVNRYNVHLEKTLKDETSEVI